MAKAVERNAALDCRYVGEQGGTTIAEALFGDIHLAGDEVIPLYVRDHVLSVARPIIEPNESECATLAPGKRETVQFTLGFGLVSMIRREIVIRDGVVFAEHTAPIGATTMSLRFLLSDLLSDSVRIAESGQSRHSSPEKTEGSVPEDLVLLFYRL